MSTRKHTEPTLTDGDVVIQADGITPDGLALADVVTIVKDGAPFVAGPDELAALGLPEATRVTE